MSGHDQKGPSRLVRVDPDHTLKLRLRTVTTEEGLLYVWDTDTMEIGFSEDGVWQYGHFFDR